MAIRTVVNKGVRVYLEMVDDDGIRHIMTFTPEEWSELVAIVLNTEYP